jgi:hypothetical protein
VTACGAAERSARRTAARTTSILERLVDESNPCAQRSEHTIDRRLSRAKRDLCRVRGSARHNLGQRPKSGHQRQRSGANCEQPIVEQVFRRARCGMPDLNAPAALQAQPALDASRLVIFLIAAGFTTTTPTASPSSGTTTRQRLTSSPESGVSSSKDDSSDGTEVAPPTSESPAAEAKQPIEAKALPKLTGRESAEWRNYRDQVWLAIAHSIPPLPGGDFPRDAVLTCFVRIKLGREGFLVEAPKLLGKGTGNSQLDAACIQAARAAKYPRVPDALDVPFTAIQSVKFNPR